MNELYTKMMREHPVQKEWKPKAGDLTNDGMLEFFTKEEFLCYKDGRGYKKVMELKQIVWLPRQEDWQRIYQKHKKITDMTMSLICSDVTENIRKYSSDLVTAQTLRWCLSVSREVYSIEWDWDNEEWVEA